MDPSDADPRRPAPHGRLTRLLVGVSATLALVVSAGSAYGLVVYVMAGHTGTIGCGENGFGLCGEPSPSDDVPIGPCIENACNYLLLGSDSRKGLSPEEQEQFGTDQDIGGSNRSDTIMVVHTDPRRDKVAVISFPRDLWVNIPGRGYDKINAAFEGGVRGGGPALVARTIHALTGLRISHFLYVDLAGFQGVVDTLGGVELCIPATQVNTPDGRIVDELTGLDVKPGCQTLDGRQALAYVRTRHLPCDTIPDFSRIGRQQQFLRAVINRILQPSELVRVGSLVRPILGNMVRDEGLNPADLAYLVGQLRGLSTGAAEFRSVPGTPGFQGDLSVVNMDPSANRLFAALRDGKPLPAIGSELEGTPPSEANIVVTVVDHGSGGKAQGVEQVLADSGFDVAPGIVTDAEYGADVKGSVIAYRPGHLVDAQVVAKYFPGVRLVEVRGLAHGPVAVFVTPSYEPQPIEAGPTGCIDPNA